MFRERTLADDVAAVRDEHAPGTLVFDCESDFETLPTTALDDLATLTESLDPVSYPAEWLPEDAPELLRRYAGSEFVVGMPGDGSVAWTHQTTPPAAFVKARTSGSPDDFVAFLVAEALVEVGLDVPEHFLGFFEERYRDLADAVPLDANSTYQIAAALYDAYVGLHTREVFAGWADAHPRLHDAWADAGERIEPRVETVTRDVAAGKSDFADATEFACSAVKHGLDLPTPFAALDTVAYRDHGAEYAVKWAEKTLEG